MAQYPKQILDINQQLQSYINAGMTVPSRDEALNVLQTIGYYRLRGYCYHLYDNNTKKYKQGTSFSDVLKLYNFDTELSHLLFSLSSAIEVSLRVRLIEALLSVCHDALALYEPGAFFDKSLYWKNIGTLSAEIGRSNDVFIKHNFDKHDGMVPIWAAVEIMSFGNLSKTIKNLRDDKGTAGRHLVSNYYYLSPKGNRVVPQFDMFTSWTHAVSVLRNICAHNGRIYGRAINTYPQLPLVDMPNGSVKYNGAFQIIMAMKYLRPSDAVWNQFVADLAALIQKYSAVIDLEKINFPVDWAKHMTI
ncbi:MAG: Abi family protein [Clostridiales bacterium]|nr:Abi family protein [Clostridiales bacterium]